MGTDRWQKDRCIQIEEARLLSAVQNVLGHQVESLRMPPSNRREDDHQNDDVLVGVPVRPFPRWLRCVKCGLLSEFDLGLFKIRENRFRPENTRFVHGDCKGSKVTCPPETRMLCQRVSCSPVETVTSTIFRGTTSCTVDHQPVRARCDSSRAAHLCKTGNLWVKCDQCSTSRNMALAFGKSGKETCHDAADATRISTATTMIAGNRRGPCCWAQPTVGSRSHYLCWRFRPRGIRTASLSARLWG